ncbi:MAG: 2-oxoacid:acceptor oxidoreductase family protein [Syntrophobacteraceae bacterium]|jgi:2-oxoglutarate ferredoxin oxidoreductase subunit gamma|nr:2-oxoacid:acceptor oxidoreductase family protein [Syntrophobacteraceae bacterium]
MATAKVVASRKEILITGFGGQGIVLAGQIVGKAASLGDHKESTLTQSYGPEARGGACSAQVIISDDPIHYPYVRSPDVLVCMSQGGFDKYAPMLREDSILLTDQDLVKTSSVPSSDCFAIPSTRMAEELGRKMMANIVMVGFLTAISRALTLDAAREAVLDSVPKGTEKLNTTAFGKGYDYGVAVLKGRQKKAEGRKGAQG